MSFPISFEIRSPEIVEDYLATLPSRGETRACHYTIYAQCTHCAEGMSRSKLKSCGRCKELLYCSRECQKQHWRTGHKEQCRTPGEVGSSILALQLAERAITWPLILEFLSLHAVLTLDLSSDRTNADRFALHIRCETVPVDITTQLPRTLNGEGPDLTAQVRFNVASISRISLFPELRHIVEVAKQRMKEVAEEGLVVAFLFTNPDDEKTIRKYDNEPGNINFGPSLMFAGAVWERHVDIIKNDPQSVVRLATLEDEEIELTESVIKYGLNNFVRLDVENKLRLRKYPHAARRAS